MPVRNNQPATSGSFGGSSVRYIEHEIQNWIRSRLRLGGPLGAPLPPPEVIKLITVRQVVEMTGLSRVQLWRLEQQDKFPRRVRLADTAEAAD
jgi:predicted DNA-binding transcriptional regulator AlpA